MLSDQLLSARLVPDFVIRWRIRDLLRQRLRLQGSASFDEFLNRIRSAPIAVDVATANAQHYEVPAQFFENVLGPRMKYSCAYYASDSDSLRTAEERMLSMTCDRAGIQDGEDILELGCGWGSLTLWMAERFPRSRILSVSNSRSQREFIEAKLVSMGLKNVEVQTADINFFDPKGQFDRVVSVEMFEHMRNIEKLFERIAGWMRPQGRLFVHIFSHSQYPYLFEDLESSDWMARHFFSGGMMPSHQLYSNFDRHLKVEKEWIVSGVHYARTARDWLRQMDERRSAIEPIFASVYGEGSKLWWARWRIFFMACEELWGWRRGEEWQVSHYLFRKSGDS